MSSNKLTVSPELPKLRVGLTVSFSDYDIEGKPQWLIYDSGRNKFYLIGWVEYEIYERWHLNSKEAIVNSINNETTLHIESIDVDNFIDFLKRNYLLKLSGHEINSQSKEQELFKDDDWTHWLISNYLFFRIPLFHPDAFLGKTIKIANILFNRYTVYLMSLLGLIALYQVGAKWDIFTHTFADIFTFKGLIFSAIAFTIGKCFHELGHAYMCKQYGVPIPSIGLAFLVFWPVLYTDTTLSWSLTNRERLRIAIAGVWIETYLSIIAALIWANTDNQTLQTICYVTITVNWVASLLINVSPFMRFDGYYILADYLKIPNLQHRAFALTRWKVRQWLFGWDEQPPERFSKHVQNILIVYSILTWLYRFTLYIGIAVLVYHFAVKAIGIILFIIEIYYFLLGPIVREVQNWYANKDKFSLNRRTQITLAITTIAIVLFFTPFTETVKFPATLSYTHQFLIAPEEGLLQSPLPEVGTKITANEPIAKIYSEKLQQAMYETYLEYSKKQNEIRRSGIDSSHIEERNILLSDLKKLSSQYQKFINIKNKLVLSVPFNGILKEKALDVFPGSYIMKNQWLGEVIKPGSIFVEAYIPQIDIKSIDPGASGFFYPQDLSMSKVPVNVQSIEIVNAQELNCNYSTETRQEKAHDIVVETACYNVSELGGEVPTYQTEEGKYVPTTSFYRVVLSTSEQDLYLKHVERGTVFINSKRHSYAHRFLYKVKTVIIEELGF